MITLSSDFGSPYPAAMKGAILARSDARLIDVAHDFPRQDVRTAAFWLREVLPEFPPAVHLVVIDPGVGTDRRAIVLRAGEHALVGPDNGVLAPAARALVGGRSSESPIDGFDIAVDEPTSATFHGRDVFAPAAAAIHETGVDRLESLDRLSPIPEWADIAFPEPAIGASSATGEVLVVDGFGTAITAIPGSVLEGRFGTTVDVDGQSVPAERSYGHVEPGTALVTVGSHGLVELAVNQGRGADAFEVAPGDTVTLSW